MCLVCALTVDVDPYGPDSGGPQSVLSLAVVAPPLVTADVRDLQSFVLQRRVALTIRSSARRLRPTNLHREGKGGGGGSLNSELGGMKPSLMV